MIFCTVGNDHHRFKRFESVVSQLAIYNKVLFQHGHSYPVSHKNITNVKFLDSIEFENNIKNADEIFSHGGAGTLLLCAQLRKTPNVLKREKKYNEHINDHQNEIVSTFEELGLLIQISSLTFHSSSPVTSKSNIRTTTRGVFLDQMTNKIKMYLK
jgi:UDP-N-acetylglucosamine transferase subunit ALG13